MLYELLTQPWWMYDAPSASGWDVAYRWFNFGEGVVWVICAAAVMRRWGHHHRSWTEWVYAVAFCAFGATDFREASVQSAALVLVKAINLSVLAGLRWHIQRAYYPDSRLL